MKRLQPVTNHGELSGKTIRFFEIDDERVTISFTDDTYTSTEYVGGLSSFSLNLNMRDITLDKLNKLLAHGVVGSKEYEELKADILERNRDIVLNGDMAILKALRDKYPEIVTLKDML